MFEQASDAPGPAFGYASAAPPPPPRASSVTYELRPLSTGEILDRTFALYRQRFWLYCGLSAMAAGLQTITSLVQLLVLGTTAKAGAANAPRMLIITGLLGMLVALLYFAAYSVTQAATVSAVLAVYLGHETTMGRALNAVRGKWWRYVRIILWQFWSLMWVPLLLMVPGFVLISMKVTALTVVAGLLFIVAGLSMIYGLIAYLRNSLAIAASVMEGLKVRASMRRSKTLAAGNKWRIFLLLLLLLILSMVAGGIQLPFVMMLQQSHTGQRIMAQGLSLALAFITNSLIGPIGAIGFCLFYIDARVRKEGFDIEALMDRTLGSPTERPGVPATGPMAGFTPSGFAPSGFTAESAPAGTFAASEFTAAVPPTEPESRSAERASPFAPSGFAAEGFAPADDGKPTTLPDAETERG